VVFTVGLSCVLPFIWELVERVRELPSAPAAVIVTEVAFVVCQVIVTAWPAAMLVLLADRTRVAAAVVVTVEWPEPELQPVNATSGKSAAIPNRVLKRVMSRPLLLNSDRETCRSWSL
jgi:hypothetical protein